VRQWIRPTGRIRIDASDRLVEILFGIGGNAMNSGKIQLDIELIMRYLDIDPMKRKQFIGRLQGSEGGETRRNRTALAAYEPPDSSE
jgi:hypothetical protein